MENDENITSNTLEPSLQLKEEASCSSDEHDKVNQVVPSSNTDNVGSCVQKRKRGRPPGPPKGRRGPKLRPGCVSMKKRFTHKKRRSRPIPKVPSESTDTLMCDTVGTNFNHQTSLLELDSVIASGNEQTSAQMPEYVIPCSNDLEGSSEAGYVRFGECSNELITGDAGGVLSNSIQSAMLSEKFLLVKPESIDHSEILSSGELSCDDPDNHDVADGVSYDGMESGFSCVYLPECASSPAPNLSIHDRKPIDHTNLSATLIPPTSLELSSTDDQCSFDVLLEARSKLESFLYARWSVVVKRDAIHVLLMSAQDNLAIQRNIVCSISGKVDLYVHCEPVAINRFLKNAPPSVPLTLSTVNKFVDRIVKIVDEVGKMEACSGFANENLKAGWKMCPLGEIDKNPYKESRYSKTFRSFNCLRLVNGNSWRCSECAKMYRPLKRRADSAAKDNPHPKTPNIYLDEEQKLKKLQSQASMLDRTRKQINRRLVKAKSLIENEGVNLDSDWTDSLMDILNSNSITPAQSTFLQEQIKASQEKKCVDMRWHPTLIRLALSLYVKSPAAYKLLRDTGTVQLSSSRTLFDYGHVNPTQECIEESVGQKVRNSEQPYQKPHVFMEDEMYVSQNLVFKKSTGGLLGFTNLDHVDEEVQNLENHLNVNVAEEE